MGGYKPLYITGMSTGLVQERQEFLLPNDAYPTLENAYVWRERIKRKQGYRLLGRLRRVLTTSGNFTVGGVTVSSFNINVTFSIPAGQTNATFEAGTLVITWGAPDTASWTDNGDGTFAVTGKAVSAGSSINYITGDVVLVSTITVGGGLVTASVNYFPGLPVMGLRDRELNSINNEQLVAFDTRYAYIFSAGGWQEFIAGFTWNGNDSDFFWSTNYWVTPAPANKKLFWVTNFNKGTPPDPIRYTDDSTWIDFAPTINAAGDVLAQARVILPFRGRLLMFNTYEGVNLATAVNYRQRIRWAAIGNPISTISALFPLAGDISANAWRDDIPGKGGFLDIPTSENIVSVGFVRDNLVIYCERSTWQLRYTGRTIAPFQIEKVNTELGAESTFSAVQFDTSLVGIGDKGIVRCDSFKSELIDVKIPDLVFFFDNETDGQKRVHGIRDYPNRLAYWTYVFQPGKPESNIYPNRRLVYNYENDSWAIFTDSLTTLGTFQPQQSRKWEDFSGDPSLYSWEKQNTTWGAVPSLFPSIVGGNQQGFVLYLDYQVSNDRSLFIKGISGLDPNPTLIQSPDHNLLTGQVIEIQGIITGTSFDNLNEERFGVVRITKDLFQLWKYNPLDGLFSIPQVDPIGAYTGNGYIEVLDGFSIISKKFNALDDGQNLQLGQIDILTANTEEGAITLNIYVDYNNDSPSNRYPQNVNPTTQAPDTFFNSILPTTNPQPTINPGLSKNWRRIICPTRGAFITIEWTLSNAQLVGEEQNSEVQIDAQILYVRSAGRQMPVA